MAAIKIEHLSKDAREYILELQKQLGIFLSNCASTNDVWYQERTSKFIENVQKLYSQTGNILNPLFAIYDNYEEDKNG